MDPTLNADVHPHPHPDPHPRLDAMRSLRSWRSGHSWLARVLALLVPIAALLAWCLLATGSAQARVQIDFDPMRPAPASSPAAAVAGAAASATSAEAPPAAPALPTLKITRMSGSAGALSALVDDTWVRRGDVVAGYRVTALRTESIELVNLAESTQRLTLRLNPVVVDRADVNKDVNRDATRNSTRAATQPATAWPSLALEK